jgi:3-hydroxybutyrate dehydrogenase
LVTGAASGIGRAIATRLLADGHSSLAVDLNPDPTGPGTPFGADPTTVAGNHDPVDRAVELFGGLELLVPCAGLQNVASVSEFEEETWQSMISLLLASPFLLSK